MLVSVGQLKGCVPWMLLERLARLYACTYLVGGPEYCIGCTRNNGNGDVHGITNVADKDAKVMF